jgi:hypothetical protein
MLKGIDFLVTLDPKVVVPGHGPVGEAKDIEQMKRYLSLLRQRVGEEIKKGKNSTRSRRRSSSRSSPIGTGLPKRSRQISSLHTLTSRVCPNPSTKRARRCVR